MYMKSNEIQMTVGNLEILMQQESCFILIISCGLIKVHIGYLRVCS